MLPGRGVADRRCSWLGIGSNSWGLWQAHCRCCSHGRTHGAWMHARVLCRLLCGTCASPLLGEQQRWRSLRAVLRWGSALVRGLQRRGDAYGCSTRCATSLTICSNAPLATVYFYSSRRDLLEIQCAASMFGWRVATHYPLLLGSRMRDETGAHNVARSDVFVGVWCLLLLVLLCCVCGSTTGSFRVVCFAAYPVQSSPGLSLRMS